MRRALDRVFQFYWGEGIADDVPALAYYLVLSLAPFALGVAAVALRLDDALSALSVAEQINRYLPEQVHGDVEGLVVRTRENSPELLAVAIAAMLWTTSGAIGVIERCLSRMLGGERHHIVLGRLRNMGLGAVVAASVILAAIGTSAVNDVPFLGRGTSPALLLVVTSLGSIGLFTTIYRYAPRAHLGWRSGPARRHPGGDRAADRAERRRALRQRGRRVPGRAPVPRAGRRAAGRVAPRDARARRRGDRGVRRAPRACGGPAYAPGGDCGGAAGDGPGARTCARSVVGGDPVGTRRGAHRALELTGSPGI